MEQHFIKRSFRQPKRLVSLNYLVSNLVVRDGKRKLTCVRFHGKRGEGRRIGPVLLDAPTGQTTGLFSGEEKRDLVSDLSFLVFTLRPQLRDIVAFE